MEIYYLDSYYPYKNFFLFPEAVQELTICKLSQCSASAGGGTDIILLCEKVVKGNFICYICCDN